MFSKKRVIPTLRVSRTLRDRRAKADLLAWPAPPPKPPEGVDMSTGEPSKAQRPSWLTGTRLSQEP